MQTNGKRSGNYFYVNHGDTLLVESAAEYGLADSTGRGRMPIFFDADSDGDLDVILAKLAPVFSDSSQTPSDLRLQNSAGYFEVANSSAHFDISEPILYGNLCDFDGDYKQDLMLVFSRPKHNYNIGQLPFTKLNSIHLPHVQDVIVGDFNGDLKEDFYLGRSEIKSELIQVDSANWFYYLKPQGGLHGLTFSFTDSTVLYIQQTGSKIPIYTGSDTNNVNQDSIPLDPDNSYMWGLPVFTGGVDTGMYIGYDTAAGQWQTLLSVGNNALDMSFNLISKGKLELVSTLGFDALHVPLEDHMFFQGDTALLDVSSTTGIDLMTSTVSGVSGDFDNDMDLDIYLVQASALNSSNRLFYNNGDGSFTEDITAGGALGSQSGSGDAVITADYNLDGYLDLFVTNGRSQYLEGPYELYQNIDSGRHWLQVDLEGVISNRDGIGAFLFLYVDTVVQLRSQGNGQHRLAQNHKRIHFGMDTNLVADSLVILWPSGIRQVLFDITSDQILQVKEEAQCTIPSNVVVSGITHNAAVLSWNPVPFATEYLVRLGVIDSEKKRHSILTDTVIFATGLKPDRSFVWRVKANCFGQITNFTEKDTFKTLTLKLAETTEFQLKPNPCSDFLELTLSTDQEAVLRIYNMHGIVRKTAVFSGLGTIISVDDLPTGIYTVIVQYDDVQISRKLHVQRNVQR